MRQLKEQSTLQVAAAAVCGASSIARFSRVVRLVPCYSVCRPRPVLVNYGPPPGVRQYETSSAGSSFTHATRLLSLGQIRLINGEKRRKIDQMKFTEHQPQKCTGTRGV